MTVLRKIELLGYDVFRGRPSLGKLDFVRLYFRARHPLPVGMGEHSSFISGPPGALQ
jgi:hypothetical protein